MSTVKKLGRKQSGIALITSLLLMVLMASLLAGFIVLVIVGQQVVNSSTNDSTAFYGAEAGLEKLTGDLGTLFGNNYAPTGAEISALTTAPPDLSAQGVTFTDPNNVSTYTITFPPDSNGNPLATSGTVNNGNSPWNGMNALMTTYSLNATAWTKSGSQVQLTRTAQSVGIPLFQFGMFSQTDLSFFAGPDFSFGGRTHTNGNLFLAEGCGDTLTMSQKVTAVGEVVRDALSNTHPLGTNTDHCGTVTITKGSGAYRVLNFGEGSVIGALGNPVSSSTFNSKWATTIEPAYNSNLVNHVKPLKLTIALMGAADPIELIRRPPAGETTLSPILGERYFAQASLRILLSDNPDDIAKLPCTDSTVAPFNLADLAQQPSQPGKTDGANWAKASPAAGALFTAMTTIGTPPLPLAASGALSADFNAADGYVLPYALPTITGYIKIEMQAAYGSPCGGWKDVTIPVLSYGYVGRNINPVYFSTTGTGPTAQWLYPSAQPAYDPTKAPPYNNGGANDTRVPTGTVGMAPPQLAALPVAQIAPSTCPDPHPNAIIRLERVRDNPSSIPYCVKGGSKCTSTATNPTTTSKPYPITTTGQACGVEAGGTLAKLDDNNIWGSGNGEMQAPLPSDFWPNALFDTREGMVARLGTDDGQQGPTLGGTMYYVELDVGNLARWFAGKLAGVNTNAYVDPATAPNNFVVYFSDRRGNFVPKNTIGTTWPPLSPSGNETGEYGYGDFINPATINGCPNNTLDPGEDLDNVGTLFTYGEVTFPPGLNVSLGTGQTPVAIANKLFLSSTNSIQNDPHCAAGTNGIWPWPGNRWQNANYARENPAPLFRRALKLVDAMTLNVAAWPANCAGSGVPCGLAIASENPVYIQGDFNTSGRGVCPTSGSNVSASVIGDAVTLLSNSWNDVNSFAFPYDISQRTNSITGNYNMGVAAGKQISFPEPTWDMEDPKTGNVPDSSYDLGTDGGVHNFLRFLEDWSGAQLNYTGSISSLFYNRQGIGIYQSSGAVYSPPNRGYNFDANFLIPTCLPPRTPMFRDINITGFTQILLAD
jgi:hypothetical protein